MKFNSKAIFIGFVVAIVGVTVFEIVVWELILSNLSLSESASDFVYSPSGDALLSNIGFFLAMILGAYTMGRVAKKDFLQNGAVFAVLVFALSAAITALEMTYYAYSGLPYVMPLHEVLMFLVDMVVATAGILLGSHLAS
ncbi:MAG: hypothetical protein AAB955_03690 [Patescibacteria group bacterium]